MNRGALKTLGIMLLALLVITGFSMATVGRPVSENEPRLGEVRPIERLALKEPWSLFDPGPRSFLPRAGSIARYEGINSIKKGELAGITTKFVGTSYFDWRRKDGSEVFVVVSKEEEKAVVLGIEGHNLNEQTMTMHITRDGLATMSSSHLSRGALHNSEAELVFEPSYLRLPWPLDKGKQWRKDVVLTIQPKNAPVRRKTLSPSVRVVGEEVIYTRAGRFSTWRIEYVDEEVRSTEWWIKGKWVAKWELDGARRRSSGELIEFKEPE